VTRRGNPAVSVTLVRSQFNQQQGGSMAIQLKKQRKWLVITAAVLFTATPSFALFGIGDIVFDPTSYASLIQQLTTLQMQYNMVKNNITFLAQAAMANDATQT
jgi:hypothetical protein